MEKPVDFPFNPPIEMADQLSLAISELWTFVMGLKRQKVVWPREFCETTPRYDAPEFPCFAEQLPGMTHRNFHLSDSDTGK
jgi:hypothetical protein